MTQISHNIDRHLCKHETVPGPSGMVNVIWPNSDTEVSDDNRGGGGGGGSGGDGGGF